MTCHRAIAAASLLAVSLAAPALAGHVKPGMWRITTTTRYVGVDKFPAIVTGKLAAQGIVYPTRPQTTSKSICLSPEDAAVDRLPRVSEDNGACEAMDIQPTADGYAGKALCRTYLEGRVYFDVAFTGDAHYEGKTVFKGKSYGLSLETWNNFSAEWTGADCSATPAP